MPALPLVPEIRLFDASGVRQPLPDRFLLSWDFELLERGGAGSGSFILAAEADDQELPALPADGWRFDVLFNGRYAYRGYVVLVRPPIPFEPRFAYRCETAGLMVRCDAILADAQFAHAGGADIADVYGWLAAQFLSGAERLEALGDFSQSIENPIGYTLEGAGFQGKSVRGAFDALAEAAVDLVVWGFDISQDGSNRLYVRKRPTSVSREDYRLRIGPQVTELELPEDISELTNAVHFIGGPSKAANLSFNPSWELPILPGETAAGALLTNQGFETGDFTGWTTGGSPSVVTSDGNPAGYARTGTHWAKLTGTDSVQQAHAASATNPYVLEWYYAVQHPGSVTFRVKVEEFAGAWSTVYTEDITTSSRSYQQYRRKFTTSGSVTQVRMTLSRVSGAVALMVDDVFLYDGTELAQDGWQKAGKTHGTGTAKIDWAFQRDETLTDPDPWHGVYSVRVVTSGCDGTVTNCFRIRPTSDHWSSVRRSTTYVLRVRMRTTAALDFRLGFAVRRANGAIGEEWGSVQTTDTSGTWQAYESTIGVGTGQELLVAIEFRTNGTYDLDGLHLFEDLGLTVTEYTPSENIERYYRVDDAALSGDVSADAAASIADRGLYERILEVPEISGDDGGFTAAAQYVAGYFNRFAVPLKRGKLTLDACPVHLRYVDTDGAATPVGMIAVDGARAAITSQFPTRISYSGTQGDPIRCEVELTNRKPDPALLLAKALSNRSTGGGGGTAGSSQGGGDVDDPVTGQLIVQEGGVNVDTAVGTLNFGAGFDVASSLAGTVAVTLDLTEQTWNGLITFASPTAGVGALVLKEAASETQSVLQCQNSAGISVIALNPTANLAEVQPATTGAGTFRAVGYNNIANFTGRRANTNRSSPSQVVAGNAILRFNAVGYHSGGAYSSSAGGIFEIQATESWTSTAWGTRMVWSVTPAGSATIAERMRLDPSGGFNLGLAADNNASALLELSSTTRGFRVMNMTTAQRDAISSPAAGLAVYDSSVGSPSFYGVQWRWMPGTYFSQTADQTVGNTVTETTLFGAGIGSLTLAANHLKAGKTVKVRIWGYIGETGTPTLRIKLKLGATVVLDSTAITLPASLSNSHFMFEAELTCRTTGASGTVYAQGRFWTGTTLNPIVTTATVTVDTTASKAVDVTATWGTANAANTMTMTNAELAGAI